MTTQAQILANRRNAQKSTGPRTQKGKEIVSQNAVKHGLLACKNVISLEDKADFNLHRNRMLAELAPATPMESMLADRIVSLSWRLKRAGYFQNQTIDALNADIKSKPCTKPRLSIKHDHSQADMNDSAPDLSLGRVALRDFSNTRVLDGLMRYERRIEQSLYKTILELQKLQIIGKLLYSDVPDEDEIVCESLQKPKI
jgi:hypothetical protein